MTRAPSLAPLAFASTDCTGVAITGVVAKDCETLERGDCIATGLCSLSFSALPEATVGAALPLPALLGEDETLEPEEAVAAAAAAASRDVRLPEDEPDTPLWPTAKLLRGPVSVLLVRLPIVLLEALLRPKESWLAAMLTSFEDDSASKLEAGEGTVESVAPNPALSPALWALPGFLRSSSPSSSLLAPSPMAAPPDMLVRPVLASADRALPIGVPNALLLPCACCWARG